MEMLTKFSVVIQFNYIQKRGLRRVLTLDMEIRVLDRQRTLKNNIK